MTALAMSLTVSDAHSDALELVSYRLVRPSDAAPSRNRHNDPTIYSVPNELLLGIVGHLAITDAPAFLILRSVCKLTRRLTEDINVKRLLYNPNLECLGSCHHGPSFNTKDCLGECRGLTEPPHAANWAANYTRKSMTAQRRKTLRDLLRRDTLCDACRNLYAAQATSLHQPSEYHAVHDCIFTSWPTRLLHCSGCSSLHPARAFSTTQQLLPPLKRVCIGREGRVHLCEHVSVGWKEVEAHVALGAELSENDRKFDEWMRGFTRVCKHPSHAPPFDGPSTLLPGSGGCHGAWAESTWPRASLRYEVETAFKGGQLSFVLSWRPHSGGFHPVDEVAEMRELFRRYRRNTAPFIVPGSTIDPAASLPEMLALDPKLCSCERDQIMSVTGWHPPAPHGELPGWPGSPAAVAPNKYTMGMDMADKFWSMKAARKRLHHVRFDDACGTSTIHVMKCSAGAEDTACMLTWYRREIALGVWDHEKGKLNPSHEWFHAVDPGSYDWDADDSHTLVQEAVHVRPRCQDPGCARNGRLQSREHKCPWLKPSEMQGAVFEGVVPGEGQQAVVEGVAPGKEQEAVVEGQQATAVAMWPVASLDRLTNLVAMRIVANLGDLWLHAHAVWRTILLLYHELLLLSSLVTALFLRYLCIG